MWNTWTSVDIQDIINLSCTYFSISFSTIFCTTTTVCQTPSCLGVCGTVYRGVLVVCHSPIKYGPDAAGLQSLTSGGMMIEGVCVLSGLIGCDITPTPQLVCVLCKHIAQVVYMGYSCRFSVHIHKWVYEKTHSCLNNSYTTKLGKHNYFVLLNYVAVFEFIFLY
jgi:hypothetical protein